MSVPTDLGPAEQDRARIRLTELAARFSRDGTLRSTAWRDAFVRTWRHPYVPAYYPDQDSAALLCTDPVRRGEWLDAVYSDTTLITKVLSAPFSRALRPAASSMFVSSSTHPSLVLDMLEHLDVVDGHRVLEIGTGTGYSTALLCARLGSDAVTSIDVDPELVDLAGERLAANGHHPTLAAGDGAGGHPPGAPYDRIIATCAVPAIPPAWLEQAAPGAVIVADVHGNLGGTVARLTVDDRHVATGHFTPWWAGFMSIRTDAADTAMDEATMRRLWPRLDLPAVETRTSLDPDTLWGHPLGFLVQWQLGEITHGRVIDRDGALVMFLLDHDGNRAEVACADEPGTSYRPVRQYGSRRLWDEVEQAAAFWEAQARPSYDRFGLTATRDRQSVWLDRPDGPHHWPLSTSR